MRKTIAFCLLILIAGSVMAQPNYVEKGKQYSLTRVYPKTGGVFKARNFQLVNDSMVSFSRMTSYSAKSEDMKAMNINFVSVKKGTHALGYGLAGAGLGLLSALYGIASVKSDPTLDDSGVNWAPFIFGFTAGGGAIGAIIGACSVKWKRLYIPSTSTAYRYYIAPDFSKRYYGVQFVCNF